MTGKLFKDKSEQEILFAFYAALDEIEWMVPCVQAPDLYFPERNGRGTFDQKGDLALANMAKDACWDCPLINTCLDTALATREEYGIWGGTNWHERKAILKRRGANSRGRFNRSGAGRPKKAE